MQHLAHRFDHGAGAFIASRRDPEFEVGTQTIGNLQGGASGS